MTDKELLELAAKAAGMELPKHLWKDYKGDGLKTMSGIVWNPLKNDGDALRLAVKLNMCVTSFSDEIMVGYVVKTNDGMLGVNVHEPLSDDQYAATRRAIVRASSEIGKSL